MLHSAIRYSAHGVVSFKLLPNSWYLVSRLSCVAKFATVSPGFLTRMLNLQHFTIIDRISVKYSWTFLTNIRLSASFCFLGDYCKTMNDFVSCCPTLTQESGSLLIGLCCFESYKEVLHICLSQSAALPEKSPMPELSLIILPHFQCKL